MPDASPPANPPPAPPAPSNQPASPASGSPPPAVNAPANNPPSTPKSPPGPYAFVVKVDVTADGVALGSNSYSFNTTGILKESCWLDGTKGASIKIPKLDVPPKFLLLTPKPDKPGDDAQVQYSFQSDQGTAKALPAAQAFFNGSEYWVWTAGAEAITFWATKPATVQVIMGFNN